MKKPHTYHHQRLMSGIAFALIGFIFISMIYQRNENIFPKQPKSYRRTQKNADTLYKMNDNYAEEQTTLFSTRFNMPLIEPITEKTDVISTLMVSYEPDTTNIQSYEENPVITWADVDKLSDPTYLMKNIYSFDKKTMFNQEDFDIKKLMSVDLHLNDLAGPKILIYHTHAYEGYQNSNGLSEGVLLIGQQLKERLESTYNVPTVHLTDRFDLVDGSVSVNGAYQRSETAIEQYLKEHPSIEVVIDLHRDGVGEHLKLVTDINGVPTAQIMFVNGISKILTDGKLAPIDSLRNPFITENLSFSLAMQLEANELYPGIMRKGYINAYRYALHLKPKSLLVEVGAQTNTVEEALASVEPLAHMLHNTLMNE